MISRQQGRYAVSVSLLCLTQPRVSTNEFAPELLFLLKSISSTTSLCRPGARCPESPQSWFEGLANIAKIRVQCRVCQPHDC